MKALGMVVGSGRDGMGVFSTIVALTCCLFQSRSVSRMGRSAKSDARKKQNAKAITLYFFLSSIFGGVYNKTVIPIALVGRDDNSQLKSNARV